MSEGRQIVLGPFTLQRVIGRGAMGEVWRATHESSGIPVAIKVVTKERARDRIYHKAIQREIRSTAALDHPSIVTVYDAGTIWASTSQASGGKLIVDSPFLALEYCSGGALDALLLPLKWSQVRAILLEVLDSLAHAHARGVIHRDLKPANILIATQRDIRPGLKLTDFGLAHALSEGQAVTGASHSAGTPAYMAPEQLLGHWRDFGPWTDLYALGCMAFEFLTGYLPFDDENLIELAQHHLRRPAPALPAEAVAPPEVGPWIQRLMAKSPRRRFRSAADAAWALMHMSRMPEEEREDRLTTLTSLPMAPEEIDSIDSHGLDAEDTLIDEVSIDSALERQGQGPIRIAANSKLPTLTFVDTSAAVKAAPVSDTGTLTFSPGNLMAPAEAPPLPNTWRRPVTAQPPAQLEGVGLGLFGLRHIPLVDRDRERDLLWDTLGQVLIVQRTYAVVLRGTTGVGKSALARWAAQRAAELGAVDVLEAVHSPIAGPAHGLPRMFLDYIRALGLSRSEVFARVKKYMSETGVRDEGDYKAAAVVESLLPGSVAAENLGRFRIGSVAERFNAFARMLTGITRERPLLVWLDDVQWGADTLEFVQYFLEGQEKKPAPILIVMTVKEEALATRVRELHLLERLEARDDTETITLEPLNDADHRKLVAELLQLDDDVASRVVERTRGNPMFAIQLVGDWVARGLLEVAHQGFVVRRGEDATIPDELHHLWKSRLERLLGQLDFEQARRSREALEMAALLGQDIDFAEWRAIARTNELQSPDGLLDALAANNLVTIDDVHWSFAHGMFRESLERQAQENQHTTDLHNRCAELLQTLYSDRVGTAERLAHHLAQGSVPERAFSPLLVAAEEATVASQYTKALDLLDQAEELLDSKKQGESVDSAAWARLLTKRAHAFVVWSRIDEAFVTLKQATNHVDEADHQALRADLKLVEGRAFLKRGMPEKAIEPLHTALGLYRQLGDEKGQAKALLGVGEGYQRWRKTADALDYLQQAQELFTRLGDDGGLGLSLRILGYCREDMGDWDGMSHFAGKAKAASAQVGDLHNMAYADFDLGMAAIGRGDPLAARDLFLRSLAGMTACGSADAAFPRLAIAALCLEAGDLDGSERWIQEALDELELSGRNVYKGAAHVGMMVCAAARGQWERFDTHSEAAQQHFSEGAVLYAIIAETAEKAAQLAAAQGETERAQVALEIALAQWRAMGRAEQVGTVSEKMERISRNES